jgi:hypothetical protein
VGWNPDKHRLGCSAVVRTILSHHRGQNPGHMCFFLICLWIISDSKQRLWKEYETNLKRIWTKYEKIRETPEYIYICWTFLNSFRAFSDFGEKRYFWGNSYKIGKLVFP